MQLKSVKIHVVKYRFLLLTIVCGCLLVSTGILLFFLSDQSHKLKASILSGSQLKKTLEKTTQDFTAFKNIDQVKRNDALEKEIDNIHTGYGDASKTYEQILDERAQKQDTTALDKSFALSLNYLSDKNYASSAALLTSIQTTIQAAVAKRAAALVATGPEVNSNAPTSNTPPAGGYSRQQVKSDIGTFAVDIISADLGSTRVIVDTASDSDCHDSCPVLSLGDYVARNGAFAGVNGNYFCPADYPSCAGKSNSYDLLVMNKNKHYFNSDNNVYSNNPVVVFGDGFVRFIGAASGWGRDTGVNGVLSNYPLLLSGGNVAFEGDGDPKKGSKGSRSFVASKGNTVYIGVLYNVTVAEGAHVLKALGLENAMNLDSGGSTALWDGGYKAGPGRNIPTAILFVRK